MFWGLSVMSSMFPSSSDVVVVGAGIVGAACACELAAEGLRVLILDAGAAGGGATAACMGQIVVMDDSEAQFALTRYSQSLWDGLADRLPAAAERDPCGTLWVAASSEEMAAAVRKHDFYSQRGVDTEILDPQSLREAEPNLREGFAGGLRVPGDSIVYPPAMAVWLLERACAAGAEFITGAVVESIDEKSVRLRSGEKIEADLIVNAAGQNALALLAEPVPGAVIHPRKGHLLITARYPGFCRHQVVRLDYLQSAHTHSKTSIAFNLQPRITGQMLLGSSRQYGKEGSEIEPEIVREMIRCAVDHMPAIAQLQVIRGWTGFRPATHDHLPLIGRVPGMSSVILAAGHEGLGITTSLGTARLVLDMALGREPVIDPDPYRPDRFTKDVSHG